MISADEARRRELAPFRGLLIGGAVVAVGWALIFALLISCAT